jgi:chromosome segregation ATPase
MDMVDVNTALSLATVSVSAYVAVRVGLSAVSTRLDEAMKSLVGRIDDLVRRIEKAENMREAHAQELTFLRTQAAANQTRIETQTRDIAELRLATQDHRVVLERVARLEAEMAKCHHDKG